MTPRARLRLGALALLVVGGVVGAALAPPVPCAEVRALGDAPAVRAAAVGVCALLIVAAVPRAALIAAMGLAFGFAWGVALAQLGAFIGATIAFALGRSLAREPVEALIARTPWLQGLTAVATDGRRGFWTAALLRVNPVLHFTLVSFAAGALPFSPASFAAGTFVGMIPMTLVVTLGGETVGCALLERRAIPTEQALGLFAAMAVMTLVSVAPGLVAWARARRARAAAR